MPPRSSPTTTLGQGLWSPTNQVPILPLTNCVALMKPLYLCESQADQTRMSLLPCWPISWGPEMIAIRLFPPMLASGRPSTVETVIIITTYHYAFRLQQGFTKWPLGSHQCAGPWGGIEIFKRGLSQSRQNFPQVIRDRHTLLSFPNQEGKYSLLHCIFNG